MVLYLPYATKGTYFQEPQRRGSDTCDGLNVRVYYLACDAQVDPFTTQVDFLCIILFRPLLFYQQATLIPILLPHP